MIEAGRLYMQAGREQKSQAAYAQATQAGKGWYMGMALWDQAGVLIGQGEHEKARQLLQQPVVGERADEIKVGLLSALGFSYYRTAEFKKARIACEQAIAQFELVKNSPNADESRGQVANATENLRWIDRWEKNPLLVICESMSPVLIDRSKPVTTPAIRQLAVRSFRKIEATAVTSDNRVKLRLLPQFSKDMGFFFQQVFEIEVVPERFPESSDIIFTAHSPQIPEFQAQVPLHIEIQEDKNGK